MKPYSRETTSLKLASKGILVKWICLSPLINKSFFQHPLRALLPKSPIHKQLLVLPVRPSQAYFPTCLQVLCRCNGNLMILQQSQVLVVTFKRLIPKNQISKCHLRKVRANTKPKNPNIYHQKKMWR